VRAPRYAPADRRARGAGFWLASARLLARCGLLVASGAFWALSGAKRWRVTSVRAGTPVGARATIRASGPARARCGLLAGVCPASGALRASGGFWRVLGAVWREALARNVGAGWYAGRCARHDTRQRTGARAVRASGWRLPGFWRAAGFWLACRRSGHLAGVLDGLAGTGVIEAAQAFARRMSRLIRSLKSSRRYGHARSGTGVSCGAARRVADDTSEAKRMIPRAPARGISSEAKPDQKRRAQDQSGAHPAAMVRERYGCRAPQRWFGR